jgi:peptide methionine sulfoxide reductase msrA/msrB
MRSGYRTAVALTLTALIAVAGCERGGAAAPVKVASAASAAVSDEPGTTTQSMGGKTMETATFAGGCSWCMEAPFEQLDGVSDVVSGYTGGTGPDPTYEDYAAKGHVEAVQITYDPSRITYSQLLEVFWRQIDPTDAGGQFVDRGPQYRSAIFYHNEEQKRLAVQSEVRLQGSGRFHAPIVTEVIPASTFYKAEAYHQNFHTEHPLDYKDYRAGSGRDAFLDTAWGPAREVHLSAPSKSAFAKPSDAELRAKLTPLQYDVTQRGETETAFENEYWDNKQAGIYVDIISGEALFSSLDKYDSGTGWPSFTKPLEPGNIVEKPANSLLSKYSEVRSKHAGSHLGDVFHDGPPPAGLRYCLNSAALRFIPAADLVKEGYGQYAKLFEKH